MGAAGLELPVVVEPVVEPVVGGGIWGRDRPGPGDDLVGEPGLVRRDGRAGLGLVGDTDGEWRGVRLGVR